MLVISEIDIALTPLGSVPIISLTEVLTSIFEGINFLFENVLISTIIPTLKVSKSLNSALILLR